MPSFGFGGEVRGSPFPTVKAGPCGTGKIILAALRYFYP